jgi:peptidoglycan hydrolase CwlO-like protein
VKELDGIKAAKDSEPTRKDREISGLVAAAAKSQTRVQDLEEANATTSEFCSTLEETGDSCRATIELLRGQLAELEEELREARATKNRRRVG